LGTMNLLSLKQKFVMSKSITITLLGLLVLIPAPPTFFLVSYMLGCVRAIRNMVYAPSVKRFAAKSDTTPYFSMASILTLPFAAGFPLLFGKMLDQLSYLQENSYRLLFAVSAVLVLITFYLSLKTDYEGTGS
jgi:hypothetical protein